MELNWLAIGLATLAGVVIGFLWFGPKTFFPVWWKLMGKSPEENPGGESMGLTFGLTFVGAFIQALVLAVVIGLIGDMTWFTGLATGALMGVGFAASTSIGHKLFGGFGLKVWLLEAGQDILALAAMGAIIASF
jgi:hypothetical protein